MRILWISKNAPYDGVSHAGGKIHNYLLKLFHKLGGNCHLISFALESEINCIDLNKYDISYDISKISSKKDFFFVVKKFFALVFILSYLLGFDTIWYVWRVFRGTLKYKKKYKNPDVIVLQWTNMVNQVWWLRRLFPSSRIVSIEEDVTFLKKERKLAQANCFVRLLKKPFFVLFKRIELTSLKLSDIVVLNNEKDRDLIVREGVDLKNTYVCHPFFQSMLHANCIYSGKDILFYGAMSRPENYQSAIWFIDNVFVPKLKKKGFRFIVVGSKPHDSLKKYDDGECIRVVGFVEDVSVFFEKSLCLVAPLLLGAGVKVKVIEAMSAGLPVLTNEIGIEGIFAKDCQEFFFCKTPAEYEKKICELSNNVELGRKIGMNAKEYVRLNFNYELDAKMLYGKICSLVGNV